MTFCRETGKCFSSHSAEMRFDIYPQDGDYLGNYVMFRMINADNFLDRSIYSDKQYFITIYTTSN